MTFFAFDLIINRTEDSVLENICSAESAIPTSLIAILSSSYLLCVDSNSPQEPTSLKYVPFVPSKLKYGSKRPDLSPSKPRIAWSPCEKASKSIPIHITSLLPVDNDHILVGDSKF